MTDRTPSTIRLRADGSIDTAHYIAIGRARRSAQAHGIARALFGPSPAPRRRAPRLFSFPGF